MRFHRNTKMLRGQLDAAPFIMVFFLVLIFVLLGLHTYTPGIHVVLPEAEGLVGTDNPTVSVAVDLQNQLYFENQMVNESQFTRQLQAVADSQAALTLIVYADRDVTYDMLVRVTQLARKAGVKEVLLATMPRLFSQPKGNSADTP